jgi:hypothetical protein
VGGDGFEGIERTLTAESILLVGKLLLESVENPVSNCQPLIFCKFEWEKSAAAKSPRKRGER